MTKPRERRGTGDKRDSASYVLRFITWGILIFGSLFFIYTFAFRFPHSYLLEGVSLAAGLLAGWISGTLLDIRKESKYRNDLRSEAIREVEKLPTEA